MVILMEKNNVVSIELNDEKIEKIKNFYAENIVPNRNEHINFQVKTTNFSVIIYKSKKAVFQGKLAEEEASLWSGDDNDIWKYDEDQIGSDEVGTGDYFGPICVCASYVSKDNIEWLNKIGVNDYKKLDDNKILRLVPLIIKKIPYSQVSITPEKYNKLTNSGFNQAKIKAITHNQVLHNLKKKIKKEKIFTIIDQFLSEKRYYEYLKDSENVVRDITFETKAESKFPSVAVASMIARYSFLIKFSQMSKDLGLTVPKGAGKEVDKFIERIINEKGIEFLNDIGKVHFANTNKVLDIMKKEEANLQ